MQHFRLWCRAFASILLIVAVATLFQGVLHEIFHEEAEQLAHNATEAFTCACHSDNCHSDHHACSSLSCSQGANFIGATGLNFCHIADSEIFRPARGIIALPLLAETFFKPPRTIAG